eukprot:584522-Rhodomonas_salina.1
MEQMRAFGVDPANFSLPTIHKLSLYSDAQVRSFLLQLTNLSQREDEQMLTNLSQGEDEQRCEAQRPDPSNSTLPNDPPSAEKEKMSDGLMMSPISTAALSHPSPNEEKAGIDNGYETSPMSQDSLDRAVNCEGVAIVSDCEATSLQSREADSVPSAATAAMAVSVEQNGDLVTVQTEKMVLFKFQRYALRALT